MQASTANTQHDRGSPVPQVPPELLETVARALAAALVPPPRQPEHVPSGESPDFLTAAQLAARLGVSRETVRRLAIAGALPHTVVCRGTRKTTRRYPRRFADEFGASGLDTADLGAFAAAWRARVTAPVDRVVAVIRRHVLADPEPSAWTTLGHAAAAAAAAARTAGLVLLYCLRFALAAPETARGLRRMVLDAAPLPALPQAPAAEALQPPRTKKAVLLALYRDHPHYGDRSTASRVAAELASQAGLRAGTARSYLYAELDGRTP